MALTNIQKLIGVGVPSEVAKVIDDLITTAAGYTDADAEAAIAAKTEVAALTSGSDAAAIVAALQA